MNSHEQPNENNSSNEKNKYEKLPKYLGRVGGVAGACAGYIGASGISAVAHHVASSGYKASKSAGIAGALIVGALGYAGFFAAGKLANYTHVTHGVEYTGKKVWNGIKKL